ncbi:MAG: phosphohistidine phosphatase SixA [Blastocatellia bacterium]
MGSFMELYLIRHAIAAPLGKANEFSDETRALTDEGRNRMQETVKGMRKLGLEFDLVLSSPLVRAVATAEIVAAGTGLAANAVRLSVNLMPGASAEALFAEIKSHSGVESVALIGHQPDLGLLASRIIQSEEGRASIQLKKGAVCHINVSETVPTLRGDLMWLLTPKQLRLLAKV